MISRMFGTSVLRFCAVCYLGIAVLCLASGLRSAFWAAGWLILALGFFLCSLAEADSPTPKRAWRGPGYSLMVIGVGCLFFDFIKH